MSGRVVEKYGIYGLVDFQGCKSVDIICKSVVARMIGCSDDWLAFVFVGVGPFLLPDFHKQELTLTGRFVEVCSFQLVVTNR